MVATDTVVGIVGAVVLVAVMAGVFVYEYNNAPEGASGAEEMQEHFEEDYPGLMALQDIDEDGTPNWNDTDLDGDGVDNVNDTMVARTLPVNVDVAAPTGAATTQSFTFQVVNGSESLGGSVSYTRSPGGQVPVVSATLEGPSGFESRTLNFVASGSTYTADVVVEEPLPAGTYTLTFRNQGPGGLVPVGQAATVTGNLEVHYASPEGGGHGH